MTEEQQGNSNNASREEKEVFDSGDFFSGLEDSVNGMQTEGETNQNTDVTQQDVGPAKETRTTSPGTEVNWDDESNPYKQRYKDSSREAVRMNEELSDLKPFVPVLNAMKNDSGLVDHVRDYLENGGAPSKTVSENLGLD